jgi:segregation and condensation protein B
MSIQAKIEAVIYAAEEPVTLAQLADVFGAEILSAQEPEQEPEPNEAASPAEESSTGDAENAAAEVVVAGDTDKDDAGQDDAGQDDAGQDDAAANSAEQPMLSVVEDAAKLARQQERKVRAAIEQIVQALIADYASDERGMEIREIAGGYRMATKAQYHDGVRAFVKRLKPPMKLSLQALETLAVIAYKQPITAPEISEIRGVDSGGVLGSLISRKLIATAGRKQVVGRPILYKTTREFLLRFGLKDLNDLPSIEEFEKMAAAIEEAESITTPHSEDDAAAFAETSAGAEEQEIAERLAAAEEMEDADAAAEAVED